MAKPKFSIIIPAYNEASSLQPVITALGYLQPQVEIIVVNDGSGDDSGEVASQAGAHTVNQPYNIGNGAAIKSGIRAARGDVLVFMDGDGQHDPSDIPEFIEHISRYAMVVGARSGGQQASWARACANRLYRGLASYVTGFKVEDLTSGFRALRADTAKQLLPLLPNAYSWPTTMTLILLRSGLSVKYVPINARSRCHGRSRIRPVRDGVRFFIIILKICTLYSPLRIFLPVSGGMFLMGLINYAYTFVTSGRFTNMSALLFTAAVILFMMGLISEQISQLNLLRQQVRPQDTVISTMSDKQRPGHPDSPA